MSLIESRLIKLEALVRGSREVARRPGISDETMVKLRSIASNCNSEDEMRSYLTSQLPPNELASASLDEHCRIEAAIAAAAVAFFHEGRAIAED